MVSSQFAEVLALGNDGDDNAATDGGMAASDTLASSSLMTSAVADHAWAGRVFSAHDHCLLIGGRLDGERRRESTLVRLPRGGHVVPARAAMGVEICMETLAMKLSEVRWREHRDGVHQPFVTLSAANVALCLANRFRGLRRTFLGLAGIQVLADLAMNEAEAFGVIVKQAKDALPAD